MLKYDALYRAVDSSNKNCYFYLFLHIKSSCGYSFETPHQDPPNRCPQHMFIWRNKKKNSRICLLSRTVFVQVISWYYFFVGKNLWSDLSDFIVAGLISYIFILKNYDFNFNSCIAFLS